MAINLFLFGYQIDVYSLFVYFSILISALILKYNLYKFKNNLNKYFEYEYLIITIIAILLGIFGIHLFATFEKGNFQNIFKIDLFSNGANFFGAIFLFFPFLYLYTFYRKIDFIIISTICSISIALGSAIGRIGCLISGDGCYGIPTHLPWGMTFNNGLIPTNQLVHPTPLYEAIIMFLLFIYLQFNLYKKQNYLQILSIFFIISGIERFIIEFIRINSKYYLLSQAQWLSIILVLVGILILRKK